MAFTLTSPSIKTGGEIPGQHLRRGDNLSPQLDWTDPPPGTRSFLVELEDADAPAEAFRHWLVYDIPVERRHLAPGRSSAAHTEMLPHAVNDFGNAGYDGPEPPEGARHTYRIRLVALGIDSLGLADGTAAGEAFDAARDHILGEAEIVATAGQRS